MNHKRLTLLLAILLVPALVSAATGTSLICLNVQPEITNPGTQIANVGQLFNFTINVTEIGPNNDTFAFTDNSSLFVIDGSTGNIAFTPQSNQTGSYSIQFNITENHACGINYYTTNMTLIIVSQNLSTGFANVSANGGIHEPLCCGTTIDPTGKTGYACIADNTYNPSTFVGDVFCEGPQNGTSDVLDNLHTIEIGLDNLTISATDVLACALEMSNGSIRTTSVTNVSINNSDFLLNYTISFNDSIIRDTGAASIHDVPWYLHNCTITASNSSIVYQQDVNRRIYVHRNLAWTAFDYQKAVFCESVPFKFFNNTAVCSLATISGALKSYERNLALKKVAGTPTEMHCSNGADDDGDGDTDSADIDCQTFAHKDNVTFYSNFTLQTRSFFDTLLGVTATSTDADNLRSATVGSTTYEYTVNTNSAGTTEVRLRESSVGTSGYGFTLKRVPYVDQISVIGNGSGINDAIISKICTGALCNVNYDCSGSTCQTGGAIDFVLIMNHTNTSIDGTYNITIEAVHGLQVSENHFLAYYDTSAGLLNNNESATSAAVTGLVCRDGVNNDLDISTDYTYINGLGPFNRISYSRDCADLDCNALTGPTYTAEQDITFTLASCEYRTELSCADGYDNDFNDNFTTDAYGLQGFPYTDCHDIDCFQNGGTCPLTENINATSCQDGINNDWDYVDTDAETASGHKIGNTNNLVTGGQTYNGLKYDHTSLTANLQDCEDPDCDGQVGGSGICEWGTELNCTDGFNNDAVGTYDCQLVGSSYGTQGGGAPSYNTHAEYDCRISCVTQFSTIESGATCDDGIDNDWDYWNNTGLFSGTALTIGGIDCGWNGSGRSYNPDPSCDGTNLSAGYTCELGVELTCDDSEDNDFDDGFTTSGGWDASSYNSYFNQFNMTYSANADCDDYSCSGVGNCPTNEALFDSWCFDGIDNDLDGDIDCADIQCLGVVNPNNNSDICAIYEFNSTAALLTNYSPNFCGDLLDNDGAGGGDNFNATTASFTYNTLGNTYTDSGAGQYPDCRDLDCFRQFGNCAPCSENEFVYWDLCFDGLDNDHDGASDLSDADCSGQIVDTQGRLDGAVVSEVCTNGFDDDGDGDTDCADTDCIGSVFSPDGRVCGAIEGSEVSCNDDYDNDGDNLLDCADPNCAASCGISAVSGSGITHAPTASAFSLTGGSTINGVAQSIVRRGNDLTVRYYYSGSAGAVTIYLGSIGNGQIIPTDAFNASAASFDTADGFTLDTTFADQGQLRFTKTSVSSFDFTVRIPGLGTLLNSSTIKSTGEIGSSLSEGTMSVQVVNNVGPTLTAVYVEPNGTQLTRGDLLYVTGSGFSGTSGGQENSGNAGNCEINITGPSTTVSTTAADCDTSLAITRSGTYTIDVTPFDNTGNAGSTISTPITLSVAPTRSSNLQDFALVHYNASEGTLQSRTANFITDYNNPFGSSACTAIIKDENGTVLSTTSIGATLSDSSSQVTCTTDNSVAALADGKYSIQINATDGQGQTVSSKDHVFFVCNSLTSAGNGWNCSLADFDVDGYTEGILSKYTLNLTRPYCDNCIGVYNPSQVDSDGDGFGDACDLDAGVCGNGAVEFGEDCDDGNTLSGDGCSSTCETEAASPGFSGGGGGGGCAERWSCDSFGPCIGGTRSRTCIDLSDCGTTNYKPATLVSCGVFLSCYDGMRNQGETGIDCGGPCPACDLCSNGILDFGEEDVDCGGVCPACASCYDRTQNQDETGIDCGGVCQACVTPVLQVPASYVRGFCTDDMFSVCLSTTIIIFLAALITMLVMIATWPKKPYWHEIPPEI